MKHIPRKVTITIEDFEEPQDNVKIHVNCTPVPQDGDPMTPALLLMEKFRQFIEPSSQPLNPSPIILAERPPLIAELPANSLGEVEGH